MCSNWSSLIAEVIANVAGDIKKYTVKVKDDGPCTRLHVGGTSYHQPAITSRKKWNRHKQQKGYIILSQQQ